ncbi:MAG: hypothetical protein M1596_02795 [Firmicutes bacterium]|nr:hypothetical protein [Bacillota bacterium]
MSTASLANAGVAVSTPAYYVVYGVQQNGQWQYPFSVSVAGSTLATIPLAVNQARHTELVEVGFRPGPRSNGRTHPMTAQASIP